MPNFKRKHYKALTRAAEAAREWRGNLMPDEYSEFDKQTQLIRESLRMLRLDYKFFTGGKRA